MFPASPSRPVSFGKEQSGTHFEKMGALSFPARHGHGRDEADWYAALQRGDDLMQLQAGDVLGCPTGR